MTGTWYDSARAAIALATKDLPADTTLDERMKVVDAAFPFGSREMWPYKAWLKARRQYLAPFGYVSKSAPPLPLLSPLERAKAKAERRG